MNQTQRVTWKKWLKRIRVKPKNNKKKVRVKKTTITPVRKKKKIITRMKVMLGDPSGYQNSNLLMGVMTKK